MLQLVIDLYLAIPFSVNLCFLNIKNDLMGFLVFYLSVGHLFRWLRGLEWVLYLHASVVQRERLHENQKRDPIPGGTQTQTHSAQ